MKEINEFSIHPISHTVESSREAFNLNVFYSLSLRQSFILLWFLLKIIHKSEEVTGDKKNVG